ncbi:MAG: FAD:protein FMN transferase ApbE [Gammaproteobacteria bacterium]|nr:MAG: FAD:protein FMN transferase ApbE [Gammaproteobacteria bacterium]
MKKHLKLTFTRLVFVSLILLSGCSKQTDDVNKVTEVLLQGNTMGTTYHVKIVATEQQVADKNVHADIDALLKQVNQQMSTYIPDSELSRFNKNTSTEPVQISDGLRRVIAESIRLGKLSGGKLDITVGPLVNLWGFGPDLRPDKIPSPEVLTATRKRIGLDYLTLKGNMLRKAIPDLYVDLSTTAKGYGVDKVADFIEAQGFKNYLVEIGGEMRLKGFKHTGELWAVAIEKPVSEERSVQDIILPKDNAIATSGDYRNYFEVDGQRFSHIIDPDTGKPINHKLVSVTVIAPSSMTADGLSTTLMVMGEEKGLAFANQHDIAALFISKSEHGFVEESTVKFVPYLK